MKKPCLLAAIASAGLCSPCLAGEFETQSLFYVSVPFGAQSSRERAPIVGFSVRAKAETRSANPHRQISIVDVRFNGTDSNLRVLGIDGRRFKINADGSESEGPNWWLIGGIAAAVAVVIYVAEESRPKQCNDATPVPPGAPPPPPRDC
jgi:hypothetical protein